MAGKIKYFLVMVSGLCLILSLSFTIFARGAATAQDVQGFENLPLTLEEYHDAWVSYLEDDCGDNPDLVPALAVLGCVAEGQTKLTNIPHLRFKETDRIRALANELRKLGAEVEERPDELRVRGVGRLKGAKLTSYGDHRMAMAFAVTGLVGKGKTSVDGAECISVSYPSFVEDMKKLGTSVELIG